MAYRDHLITTLEQLQSLYGEKMGASVIKEIDHEQRNGNEPLQTQIPRLLGDIELDQSLCVPTYRLRPSRRLAFH